MGVKEKFDTFTQEQQLEYIKRISDVIVKYVNDKSFNVTQKVHYNSNVEDFKIIFEPEKIALTGLFSTKKRYATWTLLDDGKWKDAMSITGLEVIRSDSPEIVKPKILEILKMILKRYPDDQVRKTINRHKSELYKSTPEELSTNNGHDCLGLDFDENYVKYAKSKDRNVVQGNICDLQFKDNTFDVVFSHHVFGLCPDYKKAYDECLRVCKPNGWVVTENMVPGNRRKHFHYIVNHTQILNMLDECSNHLLEFFDYPFEKTHLVVIMKKLPDS